MIQAITWVLGVSLAATVGCSNAAPEEYEAGAAPFLTPAEHLVRASMVLRGIRPSLEELDLVHEDPAYLPAIVDYYLTTQEFAATIREMHAESLVVGVDYYSFPAGFRPVGDMAGVTVTELNRSGSEVPLRLVEHVVMNDLPYTDIVTADYTMADPISSKLWGTSYDPEGERWQTATFDDGRPTAGLLSDPFVFTRHATTASNRNRGRANRIATALLCYDFLDRDITVDTSSIDLSDSEAVGHAIRENATCVSCHQTLDPLAGYLSDYTLLYVPAAIDRFPARTYNGALSFLAPADPGYFGVTARSGDVRELGAKIAEDPRFTMCAARRFYAYLAQVDLGDVPLSAVTRFRDVLVDSGMNARALARAIVLSDELRTRGAADDGGIGGLDKVRPDALARLVEDLTGYRWTTTAVTALMPGDEVGEVDLLTDGWFGYDVLAGGRDDYTVTRPSHTMSATSALVLRELAARAAPYVVDTDFATDDPSRRRLLRVVAPTDRERAVVVAQIVALHLRLYGERVDADDPSVVAAADVFDGVLRESGSVRRAWIATLYAMLQDIRIVYY